MIQWKRKNAKGQAAIEFVAISVVVFFFLLLLLSLAMLLVLSDYVEFATFMAARTYKSGFSTEARQQANAQLVFNKYFQNVQGLARNPNLQFLQANANDKQTAGVLASYDVDLFYLPPIFMGNDPQTNAPSVVRLNSEVHLGRDASFQECEDFFTNFGAKFGVTDPNYTQMMDDNGC